ncbi:MAG: hypothetical protein CR991_01550 [Proteobacteria bacterium]|nr:MAG: hypothetical protein CR991_01550 [Pseudomonadota bacterium]
MLVKEQVQSVVSPRPNSFSGLMEIYEINYIQLRLLLGDLRCASGLEGVYAAGLVGHLLLKIEVKESSKHTTTLLMTYLFGQDSQGNPLETRPDMLVRVYHDALQAEVVSHRCKLAISGSLRHRMPETDSVLYCRWRINRFLFKWLSYLRRRNYMLETVTLNTIDRFYRIN